MSVVILGMLRKVNFPEDATKAPIHQMAQKPGFQPSYQLQEHE